MPLLPMSPTPNVRVSGHDSEAYLTLTEAACLIRERKLSPVDLVRAHLDRIEALNSRLHAFITVTAGQALEDARRVQVEIQRGEYRGPLHGIPVAHKDIVWTRGVRTTAHSLHLKDWIPAENATVFERLRDSGAVSLGKTSLHEFAYGSPGPDEAFPAARHPWDLDYAPGSSSSGSAVAVAAGLCMAATGTDTGGSIRHPASVCGVVGMKATFGRVGAHGVIPLAPTLDHVGPLTRTVRDNALMLQAMAGYDAKDPYSSNCEVPQFHSLIGMGIRGLRIGIPRRFIEMTPHDGDTLRAFAAAMRVFQELGAELRDFDIPIVGEAGEMTPLLIAYEAFQYHKADVEAHPEEFGATFKERVLKGAQYRAADYQRACAMRTKLREAYAQLFASGVDVIISPGRENPADTMAELLANPSKRGITNRMYNLTGMPALTMPMGFSSRNLPMGIQIAAEHYAEPLIYRVASAYEDATGWTKRHPPL
jgi:aspartyl-tRNA(Asn)/glutamyl-tRNA(Gln) amidotransferase subunit A